MKKFLLYIGILLSNAIIPVICIMLIFYMFNKLVIEPTSSNKQIQTIQKASGKFLKEQYKQIEKYANESEEK